MRIAILGMTLIALAACGSAPSETINPGDVPPEAVDAAPDGAEATAAQWTPLLPTIVAATRDPMLVDAGRGE